MLKDNTPLVSIIIATYNRSNILTYSIQSVLNSDFKDWELLVIGDCCTDDTENVVKSFADKRITFVNLEKNYGEQSQPNNVGLKLSKGKYIAFLNHDDLWFPDHLSIALKGIEETGADLVYTLIGAMYELRNKPNLLYNYSPFYTPKIGALASSWLFKRTLYEKIGDWSFYKDCESIPSQDWIQRAWRANYKLQLVHRLTVIAVQSGSRENSYKNREWEENELYFKKINNDPLFREQLVTNLLIDFATKEKLITFKQSIKNILKLIFLAIGISPTSVRRWVTKIQKKRKALIVIEE